MTTISRSDQMRVTTDDGRIWDMMDGGAAQAGPDVDGPFEDLYLQVARGTFNPEYIINLMRRAQSKNRRIAVFCVLLDNAGQPTGKSFAYAGTLAKVRLAGYDAASHDVAIDEIIITPDKCEEL